MQEGVASERNEALHGTPIKRLYHRGWYVPERAGWRPVKKYFLEAKNTFLLSNLLAILNVLCVSLYPLLLAYIVDNFDALKREDVIGIVLLFLLSIVLILLLSYLNKITKAHYQRTICRAIRQDVFLGIAQMDYAQFHTQKGEKYASFLMNDVERLYAGYFENLIYLVNSILMLVTYAGILAFVSWQMCLVIMGSLLLILFVPQLVGGRFRALNAQVSSSKADYLSRCEEILLAHDLLDADNRDRLCALHDGQLRQMQQWEYRLAKYRSFVQIFSGSTLYLQLILCFATGLVLSNWGVISIGVFAASLLYVEYVAQYSSGIVDEFLEIKSTRGYRDGCMAYMHPSSVQKEKREVSFESLQLDCVYYRVEERGILRNISHEFFKGKKYLIVGDNGSGKSTLLRLLAGVTEPSQGRLLFNGAPGVLEDISYIPQRRYVFEGTILDNITLFEPDISRGSREKIGEMCTLLKLEYPLTHPVARNGENLSGGEIAKICLIRELYRGKGLLLVDEPMNDMDARSEKDILEFLLQLDQTVILVAHGISDGCGFDEVLCLQDGVLTAGRPGVESAAN